MDFLKSGKSKGLVVANGFSQIGQIQGTSKVQSITSPSSRPIVRGEKPHPSGGAAVKCSTLSWVIPDQTDEAQQNTVGLDQ